MSQSPASVTGHFYTVYNNAVHEAKTKCAPHPEVYAYITEAFKVINCFLRSTLSTKVTMPQYAKDAIKAISASLKKPFAKGDIITNLAASQRELYRFSDVYDLPNLKVGHLWSNLAYMSTAITAGANSKYKTATNYPFSLKTSNLLVWKLIQKCSAAPGEAEFLCDAGQCWNITSVSGHNDTYEQVHALLVLTMQIFKYKEIIK